MGKTILIIEDEQSIVDILSFILVKEGYDTIEALDGPTGLQLALEQNPDLVLLDLMLPKMDGFAVCEKIRKAGCTVPIVMLTAREEEDDKVRAFNLFEHNPKGKKSIRIRRAHFYTYMNVLNTDNYVGNNL